MLKQRIITALFMLPVALAGFFWLQGGWFALFIAAVITVGAWEWAQLAGLAAQRQRIGYAALVLLALGVLYLLPALAVPVLWLALLWWLLAVLLLYGYPSSARFWQARGLRLLIGLLVLLPAWQGLMLLKAWPLGNLLILAVMLLVWTADIGAYFVGRRYGQRKLAPAVSPGKSREGVYGGLAACLLLTVLASVYFDWTVRQLLLALPAVALLVLVSVVGDLTESMFKRQAGLKDSSALLPGHGGVLDRIDSLTAAVPLFAVLLWLYGWSAT
ncbi:phosphatidate cytidylyltransferase [Pseudomonas sp. NW5]|uniref:phosphatidate cytidylyltransferase n=1 Tax=Pseudomonas sp. NW5 TaxID=2934934 RepID=UPI0020209038|nr:phosphatidate cytidylyltransferase [Pseudomonas sp. NW5]MCL7462548.1 phosphatidate cytidylyltransferase [Pseudomonas sp. NW5]